MKICNDVIEGELYLPTIKDNSMPYILTDKCLGPFKDIKILADEIPKDPKESDFYVLSKTLLPGMSGTPVLNSKEEVIGVFIKQIVAISNVDKYSYVDRSLFISLNLIKKELDVAISRIN
ncbi:MAG: hypothetical protein ACTSXG_02725 [Alphaproteobacteria bacterium]